MSKAYLQCRQARLGRKAAKSKLKAKASRIKKQQKKHEENVERRSLFQRLRAVREERGE